MVRSFASVFLLSVLVGCGDDGESDAGNDVPIDVIEDACSQWSEYNANVCDLDDPLVFELCVDGLVDIGPDGGGSRCVEAQIEWIDCIVALPECSADAWSDNCDSPSNLTCPPTE